MKTATLAVALAVALGGCGSFPQVNPHPRALNLGAYAPLCITLCFITSTATDSEGSGNATGATVSNSSTPK